MQTAQSYVPSGSERDEIDLTPMLDVVFIMLIFFIVAATFVKEAGIDVNRPEGLQKEVNDDQGILVTIDADNTIRVDRRSIDFRAVRAVLEQKHAENPAITVVVKADLKSQTETLVQVLDASRAAGIYEIAIADNKVGPGSR
jgi:biopolymer transport protein ExbD